MSAFKPVNADHAIAAVVFVVNLDRPIQADAIEPLVTSATAQAALPWYSELPAVSKIQGLSSAISRGGMVNQVHHGVSFSFLRPNGQPMWTLRLVGDSVVVECTQYTRWKRVWEAANQYITWALEYLKARESGLGVTKLSLQVTDQFVDGPRHYDPSSLLRNGPHLGETPFRAGELWHVNIGWFQVEEWGRILNNLNVNVVGQSNPDANGLDAPPFTLTVLHFQQSSFDSDIFDAAFMSMAMEHMHMSNKSILCELLSDEQLMSIGLTVRGE